MATVIHLPQQEGIGAGLGKGFGAGIMKALDKRERQEKIQKAKTVYQGMREAAARGGRPAALEVLGHSMDLFEDPADLQAAFRMVDEVAPEETYSQVTGVGPENQPMSQIVSRSDMGRLAKGDTSMFPPGFKLGGKPEEEYEFLRPTGGRAASFPGEPEQPEGFESAGKLPLSKRPAGAVTTQEVLAKRQGVQDIRAEEDQAMQRRALELSIEREQRLLTAASGTKDLDPNQLADNYRADASAGRGAVLAGLGQRLPDGTFSFTGENERKLYYERLNLFEELLFAEHASKKGGPVNVSSLVNKAVKAFPGQADRAGDLPPGGAVSSPVSERKGPGILERLEEGAGKINRAIGLSSPKKKEGGESKGLPEVKTLAERDKLPKGTEYIRVMPDGTRVKMKKK